MDANQKIGLLITSEVER